MSYVPASDATQITLDLVTTYTPITDPTSVDFDLAAGAERNKPKPPMAVTAGHQSPQAENHRAAAAPDQHFDQAKGVDAGGRRHGHGLAHEIWRESSVTPWDFAPPTEDRGRRHQSATATPLKDQASVPAWTGCEPHERTQRQGWEPLTSHETRVRQGFNDPDDHEITNREGHADAVVNWQPVLVAKEEPEGPLDMRSAPYTPPGAQVVDFELVPEVELKQPEPPTRSVDARPETPGWSLKEALDGRTIHPWDRKPRKGTEVEFPHESEPGEPIPEPEPPPEPEIKRTYIVMNASSLVALPDEIPLEFKDLTIDLDADSFSWSMSASILNRASMEQIKPGADGPAEVIATINGHAWRFMIERYSLDRRFSGETYTVNGTSRAQLLAAPYAPKRTGRIEIQTGVVQAMTDQLSGTGFDVVQEAGLTDYIIPAGAWGYDGKTAMEVISELAAAQGAIVVPDREADTLHIRHRYSQVGPWDYPSLDEANLDAIIQDTQTLSYAGEWEPQPEHNAVFVSGLTDGVAVDVVRDGTPGDQAAEDIFDDLNVDTSQCRERGLTALAASGNQEIVTVETILPTSGAPGLIEPAMLVEFRDTREPDQSWRGNVLSNSIKVSSPGKGRVTQTVKIERHHY